MKEILLSHNCLEIWQEGERYFVSYDAGAHQSVMRRDEITKQDVDLALSGETGLINMILTLQKRLIAEGIDPYSSNCK